MITSRIRLRFDRATSIRRPTTRKHVYLCVRPALRRKNIKKAVREAAAICPRPLLVDFDLESGVQVTCGVGYLCANFSLPRPLRSMS